jgi:RNA polymerase sigma factor (sigma-70 family)
MKSSRTVGNPSADGDTHLENLVHQIAAGDSQAFRDLYDLSRISLYYCALKVVRRKEIAEDVLQEAYVTIWRLAPDFVAERGVAMAWMTVITRSRAIESLRRLVTSRESLTVSFEERDEETLPSDQPDPGSALDLKRQCESLCRHVGQLKATQRNVLRLAFLSDMTHSEVASCTGMPIGTVKTCARRGLSNLRNAMIVQASPAR